MEGWRGGGVAGWMDGWMDTTTFCGCGCGADRSNLTGVELASETEGSVRIISDGVNTRMWGTSVSGSSGLEAEEEEVEDEQEEEEEEDEEEEEGRK